MVKINSISNSGIGKVNEDYMLYGNVSENYTIAILADGMGGLSYGDSAARLVSHTIYDTIVKHIDNKQPTELLQLAFAEADNVIRKKSTQLKCKMGAAVTVLMIIDNTLYYAWQGNVRLYLIGKDGTRQLTEDHITTSNNTLLTRCVNGKGYREDIYVKSTKLFSRAVLYLCSDGFYMSNDIGSDINLEKQELLEQISDDSSLIKIELS